MQPARTLRAARRGLPRFTPVAVAAVVLASLGCAGSPEGIEPGRDADATSLRTLGDGSIVGFTGGYGSHVWLGIPYAAPPTGDLRWRAPRAPEPWEGTRETLAPGAICPQYPSPIGGAPGDRTQVVGDEDCLTLAVYAPHEAADQLPAGLERWPVMVWIHGGGNVAGYAGFYDGGRLAQEHGVVVVIPQYRLGPLGWLRHPSLRIGAESPAEASGNFGTLDLIRALEWVRDNVSSFGGDPGNVTIFGESAGGRNVLSLVLAPQAKGLFHRAVSQSGRVNTLDPGEVERRRDAPEPGLAASSGELLLRLLLDRGNASSREEAITIIDSIEPEGLAPMLRGLDTKTLLDTYRALPGGVPNLFADGVVLPAGDPLEALRDPTAHNDVPIVLGTNRDEHKTMLFGDPEYVRNWLNVYIRVRDPERFEATSDAFSQMWKVEGADEPARALVRSRPDVFVYRFDWDEQPSILGTDLSQLLGAGHGMEIPFIFGHFDLGPRSSLMYDESNAAGRQELTRAMMSYWVQFARTGDPGQGVLGDQPRWVPWMPGDGAPKMMVFDSPADGGIRMSPESLTREQVVTSVRADARLASPAARCALLGSVAERYPGTSALLAGTCEVPEVATPGR